jgi:lipopolysaccharide export system permease protein
MLGLLDRQMIYNYVKAYIVCLTSLLGLFIVVDLFTNLDDFTSNKQGVEGTLRHIGVYYGYNVPKIFDRLCEAIALLAGMFTVAWMQRNNELLPQLSAGVSTRRVVFPVLLAACGMLGLSVANQEFLMPALDGFIVENGKSNFNGDKETEVKGTYDVHGIHVSGRVAFRKTLTIDKFTCVIPPKLGRDTLTTLQAESAQYVPERGGWVLTRTVPPELDNWARKDLLTPITPGKYFLSTDVDFDTATRSKNWFLYLSTWRLWEEMNKPGNAQLSSLAVILHMRLTRPILGVVLVVLGLSVILRDQNRNVFVSAGLCLSLCALFFASIIACQYLGSHEHVAPALAAWLPLLAFGPVAVVMFDAVHT